MTPSATWSGTWLEADGPTPSAPVSPLPIAHNDPSAHSISVCWLPADTAITPAAEVNLSVAQSETAG